MTTQHVFTFGEGWRRASDFTLYYWTLLQSESSPELLGWLLKTENETRSLVVVFLRVTKFEKEAFFSQSPGQEEEENKGLVKIQIHMYTQELLLLIKEGPWRETPNLSSCSPRAHRGISSSGRAFWVSEAFLSLQLPFRRDTHICSH